MLTLSASGHAETTQDFALSASACTLITGANAVTTKGHFESISH